MKMAKASDRDIDAAGNAMSVLQDISSGYYPARSDEENTPVHFDEDNKDHLRLFYDRINETLDASPGWPGRVIGGMCYVILYDKNQIVDPSSDCLELHPKFSHVAEQRDELLEALKRFESWADSQADAQSKGGHATFDIMALREERDAARAAIAKAEGGAA